MRPHKGRIFYCGSDVGWFRLDLILTDNFMETNTKKCKNPKCITRDKCLPVESFYRRVDTPDGLQYYCKECCKKNSSDNRKKKREVLKKATGGNWWLEQCFGGYDENN